MRYRTSNNCIEFLWNHIQLAALAALLVPSLGFGQIVNASLTGTVTDPTGAAVPEASVSTTDTATGIVSKAVSDPTGAYNFPSLHPSTYSLTVEKTGFKSTVLSGITLQVDQKAVVDVQLQVGEVTTSVEVSGSAPLVQTATASVGTVI